MGNGATLPERTVYIPLTENQAFRTRLRTTAEGYKDEIPDELARYPQDTTIIFNRHANGQATMNIPVQMVPPGNSGDVFKFYYSLSFGNMDVNADGVAHRGATGDNFGFLNSANVPETWDERYTTPFATRDHIARHHFGNGTFLVPPTKSKLISLQKPDDMAGKREISPGVYSTGTMQVLTQNGPRLPVQTKDVPLIETPDKRPVIKREPEFFRTRRTGINYGVPLREELHGTVMNDSGFQR